MGVLQKKTGKKHDFSKRDWLSDEFGLTVVTPSFRKQFSRSIFVFSAPYRLSQNTFSTSISGDLLLLWNS